MSVRTESDSGELLTERMNTIFILDSFLESTVMSTEYFIRPAAHEDVVSIS